LRYLFDRQSELTDAASDDGVIDAIFASGSLDEDRRKPGGDGADRPD